MTQDYKTLRVPEEAYELAKDAKKDDETWGEYLRRCSDHPPTVREFVEAEAVESGWSPEDGAGYIPTEEGGSSPDVTMDVADELSKLRELVDRIPDRTADQLEGRFR